MSERWTPCSLTHVDQVLSQVQVLVTVKCAVTGALRYAVNVVLLGLGDCVDLWTSRTSSSFPSFPLYSFLCSALSFLARSCFRSFAHFPSTARGSCWLSEGRYRDTDAWVLEFGGDLPVAWASAVIISRPHSTFSPSPGGSRQCLSLCSSLWSSSCGSDWLRPCKVFGGIRH